MIIQQAILKLKTEPQLSAHGNSLRGYIANQFPQYDILSNHTGNGNLLYLYPRIQYRTIKGEGCILGIEEGVSLLRKIEGEIGNVVLKGENYQIIKKELVSQNVKFEITTSPENYCFIKPWIALNEENFSKYKKNNTINDKKLFLENILVGNLLSISKSLGYVVEQEIKATILKFEEKETFLKGTPMLGFLGTFSVNFEIPDYWGIGKSVSRGFGTVKKL